MSVLKSPVNIAEHGFTIVELMVVMVVVIFFSLAVYSFANTSINQYLGLQQDSLAFSDLAVQSQRLANVLRGLTDITSASANDITAYAYFSPNDNYVSLIHYYKNAGGTILFADVTPLDANPPTGNLLSSQMKTYTIIDNFYSAPGVSLFIYLDSGGNALNLPIADLHTIKGIQINLAVPAKLSSANGSQTLSMQVSLRNRKTNL